jgi:hypothetical protein
VWVAVPEVVRARRVHSDRDSGELRFSIRSLQAFLPWWEGMLFIVAPKQTPAWIDTSHPRLRIVDQDEVYPPGQVSPKRLAVESPWSRFTSACQRFWTPTATQ